MRITDIEIEHFGVWRDLSLPLQNSGLNVVYGPNEAGKTTLMRFIRGVLYGYKSSDTESTFAKSNQPRLCKGRLGLLHRGRRIALQRIAQDNGRGIVTANGLDDQSSIESFLSDLLQETDEKLFENVFAIGLSELQELATLHDQDVAKHIYGLTLGPQGQQLLGVVETIESDRKRLLDRNEDAGELAELFIQHDQLSKEIDAFKPNLLRHADLCADRIECETVIDELTRRRSGLNEQLQGHQFLDRVYSPWSRARKYECELKKLPVISGFPEDGLETIDEIDRDLESNLKCHDSLLTEADQFSRQAEGLSLDPEIQQHAVSIQGFADQAQWIRGLEQAVENSLVHVQQLHEQLNDSLGQLGQQWTAERIKRADTTAAAYLQLVSASRNYRSALARRARIRRRLKKLTHRCQQQIAELNSIQEELADGLTIEQAIQSEELRLGNLEDLGRLKLHESELGQRLISIGDQLVRLGEHPSLPKWYQNILWVFVGVGVMATIGGLIAGTTINWIAGFLFIFIGITSAGSAWAFKLHYERQLRDEIEQLEELSRELETELCETREAVRRLTTFDEQAGQTTDTVGANISNEYDQQSVAAEPSADAISAATTEVELIRQTVRRIAAFEGISQKGERTQELRRRLSEYRARLQNVQRDVATERQSWCEALTRMGFDETVSIKEAFATYEQVVEANDECKQLESATEELQDVRDEIDSFRSRVEELGHRMHRWDTDYEAPMEVVGEWESELKTFAESRQQRMQLQRDEKARRVEAREYEDQIDNLKTQRAALLVQGGAATREEFEQRALSAERREELELLQDEAREELRSAAESEPQLAIVEEDLLSFDAEKNSECIDTLQSEIREVERDLQQSFESLGRLKQEITTLESDRRSTQLRFDREQVATQLRRKAEEWFAVEMASQTVEQIRTRFEKNCQPAILASAAKCLDRLSGGKYKNIWTPLGKRLLCVDDDDDSNTLRVEQLSGGTREQLFLAIRLAMVSEFSQRGVELPMVLDDIIVNFDQLRTEAAVDELMQFAENGQQILFFTCHLHLAQLFESKGIAPIWLPGHHAAIEERKAG